MFDLRTAFDGRNPRAGHLVFASEYAVTDGGGYGNLIGAVAEAAFMTGLERNGEAVPLAAYAPLFVHWNNRPWPTNMIVIDNHRWFGIPSYHVQRLFRETQGVQYIDTQVEESPQREVHEDTIAASATCQDEDCDEVVIKVINFSSFPQAVKVAVKGGRRVRPQGQLLVLTSDHPEDENSFDEPLKVAPVGSELDSLAETFMMELLPWSVNAMRLTLDPAPSMARLGGGRGGTATA